MVTKNATQERRLFVFIYPGKPTATVNVVVATLKKARNGRANAQRSLLYQYRRAANISEKTQLKWSRLELQPHQAK